MDIDHPFPWHRIPQTLEATPNIIKYLVANIADSETDFRPDRNRLTIREIVPHLTAWDQVIQGHLRRICLEDVPDLDDEDHNAADMAGGNPGNIAAQCTLFAQGRAELVAFLRERAIEDWGRKAIRSKYGPTTLDAQAVMIAMHDTYHIKQIVEWRQMFTKTLSAMGTP